MALIRRTGITPSIGSFLCSPQTASNAGAELALRMTIVVGDRASSRRVAPWGWSPARSSHRQAFRLAGRLEQIAAGLAEEGCFDRKGAEW